MIESLLDACDGKDHIKENRRERPQFGPRSAAVRMYGEHRRIEMQRAAGFRCGQKKINKNGTLIQTDMRAHTTQKPKPHCLTDSGMAAFSFAVEPICDVNSALKEHRIRRRCMCSGGTLDGPIDDR